MRPASISKHPSLESPCRVGVGTNYYYYSARPGSKSMNVTRAGSGGSMLRFCYHYIGGLINLPTTFHMAVHGVGLLGIIYIYLRRSKVRGITIFMPNDRSIDPPGFILDASVVPPRHMRKHRGGFPRKAPGGCLFITSSILEKIVILESDTVSKT